MEALKIVLAQATHQVLVACDEVKRRNETLEQYLFGTPELWCVKLQVAGHLTPMRSKEAAERYAEEVAKASGGFEIANVVPSPWPADVHQEKTLDALDSLLSISGATIADLQHQVLFLRKLLSDRGTPAPVESET